MVKVKNSILELEKDFIELKDGELKSIIVSIDDMDKFGQKGMKNIRPIKNTWYNCLINYILEPMRESVGSSKDKNKHT